MQWFSCKYTLTVQEWVTFPTPDKTCGADFEYLLRVVTNEWVDKLLLIVEEDPDKPRVTSESAEAGASSVGSTERFVDEQALSSFLSDRVLSGAGEEEELRSGEDLLWHLDWKQKFSLKSDTGLEVVMKIN